MNTKPSPSMKKHRRKKRMKPWQIALCAFGILLVGVSVFLAVYFLKASEGAPPIITPPIDVTTETPSPGPVDSTRKQGIYTFLVVGLDHPQSTRNTDVLMLVSFDTNTGSANVLQIPRDIYVNDPLMEGEGKLSYSKDHENRICKINNIFNLAYAAKQAEKPDATSAELYDYAMGYLKNKISSLFCVPVDFYISFNTVMFRELLEIVCPITVDVPFDMNYDDYTQDLHIHLQKGMQELNAEQAEGFARFRQNNRIDSNGKSIITEELPEGDFTRVKLQKMILAAIAQKVFSSTDLPAMQSLVGSVINNINTNLTLDNCTWFAKKAFNLFSDGTMSFSSIRMYDLPCYVPSTITQKNMGYTQDYGFMGKPLLLTILNQAFNVYEGKTITEDMLNFTPPFEITYYDHKDTEGKTIQEIMDNPPEVSIS